jgi:hypothetical protein
MYGDPASLEISMLAANVTESAIHPTTEKRPSSWE